MPPICTDAATAPAEGASGSAVAEDAPAAAPRALMRKDRAADARGAVPRHARIRYGADPGF